MSVMNAVSVLSTDDEELEWSLPQAATSAASAPKKQKQDGEHFDRAVHVKFLPMRMSSRTRPASGRTELPAPPQATPRNLRAGRPAAPKAPPWHAAGERARRRDGQHPTADASSAPAAMNAERRRPRREPPPRRPPAQRHTSPRRRPCDLRPSRNGRSSPTGQRQDSHHSDHAATLTANDRVDQDEHDPTNTHAERPDTRTRPSAVLPPDLGLGPGAGAAGCCWPDDAGLSRTRNTPKATERAASVVAVGELTSDELTERSRRSGIAADGGGSRRARRFLLRVADRERATASRLDVDDPLRAAYVDTALRLERDAGPADLRPSRRCQPLTRVQIGSCDSEPTAAGRCRSTAPGEHAADASTSSRSDPVAACDGEWGCT